MARFRPARPEDVDAIVGMMRGYYEEDGYPFVHSEARAAALALLNEPHLGCLWVTCEGERVVGYVAATLGFSFEYRGREAFVDELFIAETHRGRGLGREALEVAEAYCREMGVNAMHLEVERHRPIAQDLYRRAGFEDYDRYLLSKWIGGAPNRIAGSRR